ncbi:hypothetical protein MIND_01016400 [Mycena indigotica]|uniref:SNF7 family protein n=1 Tax=Mycena indigotica TaxID=2126181 RepID=A0A8H6S9E3_9AGAR|nr:uncharacterized protein MIND_01016400 [Mycena indigotica]KAF7294787.1 hypothetical protein MIND_01016400 [Mycena indigotica]
MAPSSSTPSAVSASNGGPSRSTILWSVIGGVAALCVGIALLVVYKIHRQRRRRAVSVAPSAVYGPHYVYARLANPGVALTRDDVRGSEDSRRTVLPKLSTPEPASSSLTLPIIDDASSISSYSPAVESSEVHAHSPIIPLSHFAKLVPLRRGMQDACIPSPAGPPPQYAAASTSRLSSLYADISPHKKSNPASFSANVEWWRTTLEAVVSSGIQPSKSRLVLKADASLMALLRVPGAGRPLALPTVLAELRSQKALFTQTEFLNSVESVYNPGWLPGRIVAYVVGKPLWWALEQLGVVGEDSFVSGSSKDTSWWGEYVILSLVESAAEAVLEKQAESVGEPADSLYSQDGFKKNFVPALSDTEVKILLKFLQRDRGAVVVDGDVIKFVDTKTSLREITAIDRGMLELKEAVDHLKAKVASIQQEIDKCTQRAAEELQRKHKSMALSYLRSRKQLEDLLQKRLGSLATLEATQMSVQTAAGDVEILKSYEASTSTLRSILAHQSLQRDSIDKTMDALAEANADAREVDEAIRIGGDIALGIDSNPAFDEDDLEEELKRLAKEDEEDKLREKLQSVGLSTPLAEPNAEPEPTVEKTAVHVPAA